MATNGFTGQGVTLEVSTDGGSVYNAVAEVLDINGPDGAPAVVDFTHLGSTYREKKAGILDEGQVTLTCNLYPGDTTGQEVVRASRAAGTELDYKITLADGSTTEITFKGLVLQFGPAVGGVDDPSTVGITIEVTNAATWT